jgi:hypothetical protein
MSKDQNPFGQNVIRRPIAVEDGVKAGNLVVGTTVPAHELQLHGLMYQNAPAGAHEVMFEDDDEDVWFKVPVVYGQQPIAGLTSQAERWQKIMSWPRLPTYDEAEQWRVSVNATAYNALSDAIMNYRARWAEAEQLAALGDGEFWRTRLAIPDTQRAPSEYETVFQLITATNPAVWPAWRDQAAAEKVNIQRRRERAANAASSPVDATYTSSF